MPPDGPPSGRSFRATPSNLKGEGFPLAWHNHDFEMVPLADGKVPMDLIFAAAPDLLLGMRCRLDRPRPASIRSLGSSATATALRAVHLKDLAPDGTVEEDGWADVGQGRIDWKRLLPALAATKAVMIVEHDNPADFERFARRSREAVAKW